MDVAEVGGDVRSWIGAVETAAAGSAGLQELLERRCEVVVLGLRSAAGAGDVLDVPGVEAFGGRDGYVVIVGPSWWWGGSW